ncbi:MAG: TatD family hydrolase, partial [Bacteroidales bacterium]|nr:TatD family hydrolase [Bacteroidales bacterium]
VVKIVSVDLLAGTPVPGNITCSMGIHPWSTDRQGADDALRMLEEMTSAGRLAAVGECGLDRLKGADLSVQTDLFRKQAAIAAVNNLPVVVHCVRCWQELISLRKEFSTAPPWIIHGFIARRQVAEQLIRHGFCLSFGPVLLRQSAAPQHLLPQVPPGRLFLETDDSGHRIAGIYSAACSILEKEMNDLKKQVYSNFKEVFHGTLVSKDGPAGR